MNYGQADFPKPYQITFEHRPQYLYVEVNGEHDSYEISKRYWQEISDECAKTGYKKVLVVEDIPEEAPLAEVYQLSAELPQMFFGIRAAFVDRYIEQQELNQFSELVAVNRGFYCKIFNEVKEAEEWLLTD